MSVCILVLCTSHLCRLLLLVVVVVVVITIIIVVIIVVLSFALFAHFGTAAVSVST